jgi:hypothetical protein
VAERAAHHGELAAQGAMRSLAFEHAASLYRQLIDLEQPRGPRALQLHQGLGLALVQAGRGREAAHALLEAVRHATAAESSDLRRRAAEQLLISGHLDEGLEQMDTVLRSVDMQLARTPGKALGSFLWHRAQVRLRGLGFRERDPSEIPQTQLARIDICASIAVGVALVDPILGADFQSRNLLLSLQAGEPSRVAKAMATEAAFSAVDGGRAGARTRRLLLLAEKLVGRNGSQPLRAYLHLTKSIIGLLEGRYRYGLEQSERSNELYASITGVHFERISSHCMGLWCLFYLGRFEEISRRSQELVLEARARGDRYSETSLRQMLYAPHLAADDPKTAWDEGEQAMALWTNRGFTIMHLNDTRLKGDIDLYRDRSGQAYERTVRAWPALKRSLLMSTQAQMFEMFHLRARCAIASARHAVGSERKRRLADARSTTRAMRRQDQPWGNALVAIQEAGIAQASGDSRGAADALSAAIVLCEETDLAHYGAAARYQLARLNGGELGRTQREVAEEQLRSLGVRNVERMSGMLVPGFRLE